MSSFPYRWYYRPTQTPIEAIHTSFVQRLMFEEMNTLARTDNIFHPLMNQVLQEAPLHQPEDVIVPIEEAPAIVAHPVVMLAVDLDDEIAPELLVPAVHPDQYHPGEASGDEEEELKEDPEEEEMEGWGPEHVVHPYPKWNADDDDADNEQEPTDEEDLAEDDEFDMYLDLVPPEEEDGPHDSDMGEIAFESDMDNQTRMTTYYRTSMACFQVNLV